MDYRDRLYAKYASEHTGRLYGETSLADIRAKFPALQKYFGDWLPIQNGVVLTSARLLDIGCGNGDMLYWLQSKGYEFAEGIDRSPEQVELGKKLGINGIIEASIEEFLPKHPASYYFISARDVLEHFKKDELLPLLDQIHSALKPGGVFVAQTVNAQNPLWGRLRHGDFTHENVFTDSSIRQVLLAAGFGEIEIRPQRPVVHGLFSAVRAALWWAIEIKLHIYLLIETGSPRGIFTQNLLVCAKK